MERLVLVFLAALGLTLTVSGLENGLARTPPMGWLAWERFQCNIDCARDPENCISERLFKEMAEILVSEGYRDAGYVYVNIDDCWSTFDRDANGRLQADPVRFPSGIKHLADFMHARGLKLGIYGDVGTNTCAGYPGSYSHLYIDAQTFADWDVDMVKMDGCNLDFRDFERVYTEFGQAINRTGRPMVYSCSWPAYEVFNGITPNYPKIGQHCNLWRNYMDIADTWVSVEHTIDFYASIQTMLAEAAAPGRWNDPDMLIIGNFGLSYDQSKTQMALWAILAAPLLMSNDLRRMRPEFKQILLNKDIIAVNQDPLGRMGQKVQAQNGVEIWRRPITPLVANSAFSFALVAFNRNIMGGAIDVPIQLKSVGLLHGPGYRMTDLFESKFLGVFRPEDYLVVKVNPSGVAMVKAEAIDLNVPAVSSGPVDVQQHASLAGGQAVGNLGVIQALPQPSQVLQDNPAQRPDFLIHTGSQGFRQRRSSETEREDARDK